MPLSDNENNENNNLIEKKDPYHLRLIQYIKDNTQSEKTTIQEVSTLIKKFSQINRSLNGKCNFGKYRNKTWKSIKEFDSQYIEWLCRQQFILDNPDLHNELKLVLES